MNRILIVEDELAISESLKSFLEAEGFYAKRRATMPRRLKNSKTANTISF